MRIPNPPASRTAAPYPALRKGVVVGVADRLPYQNTNPATIRLALCLSVQIITALICSSPSAAQKQKLGNIPIKVQINNVDIDLTLSGAADLNTQKGAFNLNAEAIASVSASKLADATVRISETVLPRKFPVQKCELEVNKLSDLKLWSEANEIHVNGVINISLRRCYLGFNTESRDIRFQVELQPAASPKRLGIKIMRPLELDLPMRWFVLMGIFVGDPEELVQQELQKFLDANVFIAAQAPYNVRMAIQGASVSGDTTTITFLLRGDAHIDGPNATSALADLITTVPKLNPVVISIPVAKPVTN